MFKVLFVTFLTFSSLYGANSCIKCHDGIADIRDPHSKMMEAIYEIAEKAGHKGNDCIVCHGGNPTTMVKKRAHKGTVKYFLDHKGPKEYYPAPGSPWINQNTCGMCHQEQVSAQMNNLMNTEGGKIHGAEWGFGGKYGYKNPHSTYDVSNPKDPHKRLGTDSYRAYMTQLAKLEPQGFPKKQTEIPKAPTAEEVKKDPSLSVYTYLRQECLRCHTAGKGRARRGDYRGIGCASCHIPYSNNGHYEGNDKSIDKKHSGHLLVHSIQSTRDAKVTVHDITYSGVPVETCTTCHNRGKRIGVSYQGLMETEYQGPWGDKGQSQPKLHTKRYMHMQEDIHYKKGMLCQDCHTSNDLHGDGFISGANLGAVEIECQDCHGTTKKYPWELPLGYSDEFSTKPKTGEARGVTKTVAEYLKYGSVDDAPQGHLLSARGNPLVHTEKKGNKIIVHLASGKDLTLTPLKALKEEEKLSKKALVAMDQISAHTDKMECYTCHATWAPQCYGCHVKIDYSGGKQNPDYLAASHATDIHGKTGEMINLKKYLVDGKVTETRSYLRWENPALSQNGEGRISPTIPGCQVNLTVIGRDGKAIVENLIPKIPNVEGAGKEGQNAIVMSPVQPHTISKRSRSCESCHTDPKAAGYGEDHGRLKADQTQDTIIDLMTADGQVLAQHHDVQIPGIAHLKNDWDRFVDENGTQLQSVGNHWKLSAPLSKAQRDKLDRSGVCLSCHKNIPDGDLAVSAMVHMAEMSGVDIDREEHGNILNKILLMGAWLQVLLGGAVGGYIIYRLFFKRKNPRRWK